VATAPCTCRSFAEPRPVERQTWRFRFGAGGVQAVCEFPSRAIEFDRGAFAADPSIAAFNWMKNEPTKIVMPALVAGIHVGQRLQSYASVS